MYYRVCQKCGAALDPGERCDCEEERIREREREEERIDKLYVEDQRTNQLTFNLDRAGA